ncbi:hypothetical protein Tco_0692293, partial [Tanacetum coccineum]
DMGEVDVILGIRTKHESNGISISQSYYIKKVLKKFNYFNCTLVSTPMDTSEKLIPNNVGKLSRYISNPDTHHWQAIQWVLKYLKKTMDCSLTYTGYPSVLEGYTNASWINNTEDNSSTSGWVFLLGGVVIWKPDLDGLPGPYQLILDKLELVEYGYIKNHKKTIKNGQARTRERKSAQKPEAKPKKSQPSVKQSKESQTEVACKNRFGRESYENLFGGFDHDFQPETRRLELTKLEQNQYWWVESERYFEAQRVLSRPNDLPPPNPIKNRIPRKPERTNIMPNSTTIWVNAVKEIAELKARINNWTGFGEVDINALVTRLANLEGRMKEYEDNRKGGYCDRDVRIDSGLGMQDHSRVDTVVRMDTGVKMSSGVPMDSGVGKMPDLNFHEDVAMDDSNTGLNSGWLNSMSTPQGQLQVFSTPNTQVNMVP